MREDGGRAADHRRPGDAASHAGACIVFTWPKRSFVLPSVLFRDDLHESCISHARASRIVGEEKARGWRRKETADSKCAAARAMGRAEVAIGRAVASGSRPGGRKSCSQRHRSPAHRQARARQTQRSQQVRNVTDVVAYAVPSLDEFGNPWARPDIGGESVGACAGAQPLHQAVLLPRGEEGRAAGLRPVIQTPSAAATERLPPPPDATGISSHTKGDLVYGQAAAQESKGPTPTPLQVNRAAVGSHLSHPRASSGHALFQHDPCVAPSLAGGSSRPLCRG
jgi:hypothetical protein